VKPVQVSKPASEEFAAAIRWYERQRVGLGGVLFDAVSATIDLIREHPEIGMARPGRRPSRQIAVIGFPYRVVYRIREQDSYIVAIAHYSRRPGYWKHRL
jgi:plasmid stabilization system protein ParE